MFYGIEGIFKTPSILRRERMERIRRLAPDPLGLLELFPTAKEWKELPPGFTDMRLAPNQANRNETIRLRLCRNASGDFFDAEVDSAGTVHFRRVWRAEPSVPSSRTGIIERLLSLSVRYQDTPGIISRPLATLAAKEREIRKAVNDAT